MIQDYPITTATTANGIRVILNHDPWVSAVALNLWYDVGSSDEVPGQTGLAHLFEHLMFSGSAAVANGEHLGLIQSLGGDTNATTSFDRTDYYDTVPARALDLVLWLEADRLASLGHSLDQTKLDTQRAVVEEEKRLRYDNVPYGDAFAQIMDLVFGPDHAYGHTPIGHLADLNAASLTDVRDFFARHYRPANLTIALAGAFDPSDALDAVERHFGQIPAGAPPSARRRPRLAPMTGLARRDISADVPQDAVYCVWRVPPVTDPASDALGLGLSILTDGLAARLYQALIVTGLADSVDAFDLGLRHGSSLVGLVATCDEASSPEQVENIMLTACAALAETGPTTAELDRVKIGEERDWLADLASPETRAEALAEAAVTFGDAGWVNRHLDQIKAVSPDQVRRAFARYLAPANRATLTYRRSL